jgi:ABC-2 type transport system ATP-binding protein
VVAEGTPEQLKSGLPTADVIEVRFDRELEGWGEALRRLPAVEDVREDGGLFRIQSRERSRSLPAIVEAARVAGLGISALSFRENTMEDVFLHHTGRATRDEVGRFKVDTRVLQT